jgi:hypothetical protein
MLTTKHPTETSEQTRLVAKAAFPRGSFFITLYDEPGTVFEDAVFVQSSAMVTAL